MRICLIGGIYDRGGGRKRNLRIAPESTLEAGLRAEGLQVSTLSHYDDADFGCFDVVHVHHLSWGALRLACDRSGARFVFTAHDASRLSRRAESPARRLAMRLVLARADGIVALTESEAAFQRRFCPVDGASQAVVPNGIDDRVYRFERGNDAGRGRPWQLLYVGQLIPLKGVDVLLRALARLGADYELKLVYQNAALEGALKTVAAALRLSDRVQFLGRREPEQLAALYHSADLLVLPSLSEALPSVIGEAMFCGLPFVATRVGGVPEQANGFGHLVAPRDDAALAAGIEHTLEHYQEFAQNGEAMSRQARERFSIPSMIRGHVDLYQRLTGSAEAPRRRRDRRAASDAVMRLALRSLCRA